MQELTQVNYRYTFPNITVTNIKVPEGMYTHDFRGKTLVLKVDRFGEVRVANETPCNNERKLALEISKFKNIVANTYQIITSSVKKISLQEAQDRKMFGKTTPPS